MFTWLGYIKAKRFPVRSVRFIFYVNVNILMGDGVFFGSLVMGQMDDRSSPTEVVRTVMGTNL